MSHICIFKLRKIVEKSSLINFIVIAVLFLNDIKMKTPPSLIYTDSLEAKGKDLFFNYSLQGKVYSH